MRTRNLQNASANNTDEINTLHPEVRTIFTKFIFDCEESGIPVWIYSGYRSFDLQSQLFSAYATGISEIPAAKPGSSYHNYGLAIDIYVYDEEQEMFLRTGQYDTYKKLKPIAAKYGLRWLGSVNKLEMHHFDYNKVRVLDLLNAQKAGKTDENSYVLFSELDRKKVKETVKKIKDEWQTEIGKSLISESETETEKKEKPIKRSITRIEKKKAVGIWQIVKLVADQYSLSQSVNDASIAYAQGSLINYINKVVQEPWLQFYGDTVKDQYYFFVRKEPFDYNGWTKLPEVRRIFDDEVLSDDLNWYDGQVFSWFQIIPKGSFLGEQNLIFAYITSVFFEEYAEIWGSKPNIQVSNYLNFTKIKGNSNMYKKALEDLRYMVESNMYLPFTRQGTITIAGTTNIKRGFKIFYHPTGEEFYVDAVSTRYSSGDQGSEIITILQVSRGMKIEYTLAPKNSDTIGYFNLINFTQPEPQNVKYKEKVSKRGGPTFYFDSGKSYTVNLTDEFEGGSNDDLKMRNLIESFPDMRNILDRNNKRSIEASLILIRENPQAKEFTCTGYVDDEVGVDKSRLAKSRAETSKQIIIEAYLKKYSDRNKAELESVIFTKADTGSDTFNPLDIEGNQLDSEQVFNTDIKGAKTKAYQRHCLFIMEEYEKEVETMVETDAVNWKVNDKVFQFFVNRKQFGNE